jgi:hypothetical protein
VFDIQFDIGGKLAAVTVRAQVVGRGDGGLAYRGQHWFGAQFQIAGGVATRASKAPLLGRWDRELQQLAERRGSGVMHGGTHRHRNGLQIETARPAALQEDHTQELVYLVRDFLTDRFGRFFPSGESVSSTGRARQICTFTLRKARLNSR